MTAVEFHHQLLKLESSLEKFAYRLTQKKSDVGDLVQETFLKVLKNQDKFVRNENFKAWTFTIMRNTFINNYRRSLREHAHYEQSDESFYLWHTNNHTGSDNPHSTYSALEITRQIEQLSDTLRTPFKMYIHGYRYREIADELNLNLGSVKRRIYFARKHLMEQLNG